MVFAVNGIVFGTFAARLPWIAARLHLSSGMLGAVGLTSSAGALLSIAFAARFVHRYGAQAATRLLIAASSAALALPAFAPDLAALAAAMLIFGGLTGITDNAMNAQAVEAEQRAGRPIMSGLHGLWSVGVLVGALAGSLAAQAGVSPQLQFPVTGAAGAVAGVIASQWCAAGRTAGPTVDVPRFAWPRGRLLGIGIVGFAAIFVEFAANDWSAVFLHWDLHASQAAAAVATGVFAGAMAAGRLGGDQVVARIGPVLSVRLCGVLGTAGCLLVAVAPAAIPALAGFALIGAGVSVVVPLVFSAAGRAGPSAAISVAKVATVSYGAGLAAPSVIGGVADITSLRAAFGATAMLAAGVCAGASLLRSAAVASEEDQLHSRDNTDQDDEDPQRQRGEPAAEPGAG